MAKNAFARVLFAAEPPVKWEVLSGQVRVTAVLQTSVLEGKRSVAMQSGLGDGTYVVYGSYAANGTLTRLLVDFDLFG